MDGQQQRAGVEAQVALIKRHMPHTYEAIQRRAGERGRAVYAQVRRGLAGEPNRFWAMEAGHVMGTPFAASEPIAADVALGLVVFGSRFVVVWGESEPWAA